MSKRQHNQVYTALCWLAGPICFILAFFGYFVWAISTTPYLDAGNRIGIFVIALMLTVLLWPACVALLLNLRDSRDQKKKD